ncbi:hypothetical protein NE237_001408 [Protea cynaroides]|uniref:non-specific serine/threonine protein kinase n=1 Tax=Protea cynaroides TaxID=273540 RepID=A0A9Q0QYD3_9MAGN|nr:hypothetical protein NE237_001408 [Protea cynaroides]
MCNLSLKDFDIRKEAGGVSFSAVEKVIQAQVLENFLEVHLFWAGKGTCCITKQGTYGPSISAISAVPNFVPTVSNTPRTLTSTRKTSTGLVVEIAVAVGVVCFLFVLVVYYILQRRKDLKSDEDEGIASRPNTFSYAELRIATEDFNPANKLGEGGFGPVYMGTLPDGRVVAVKQLSVASHQGKSQFITEIATISAVQHRNLVRLYGCCIEGDRRLLVYEYHENKSLDQELFVAILHQKYNGVEAKRLIGVVLLCTQASPSLCSAMSRVVAMLSGDIEVSTVTSKPGYLTDWEFNDRTCSFAMSGDTFGVSTSGNPMSKTNSLNPSTVFGGD